MEVVGVLLAAGAGRRMGGPKALLRHGGGKTMAETTVAALRDGGCSEVIAVVGAAAVEVTDALGGADPAVQIVRAPDWDAGRGASLRAGLVAASETRAQAALVMLVDLPSVGAAAIRRVADGASPEALARASYGGRPGHPVLLGRSHWRPIVTDLDPEHGANPYLRRNLVRFVPCDELADGFDVDRPADAQRHGLRW